MKGLTDSLRARYARMAVITILVLYPLSHFPLLPGLGISPFQLVASGVAVLGLGTLLLRLVHSRTVPDGIRPFQPFFWFLVLVSWLLLSFLWGDQSAHELYYIGLLFIGVGFAFGMFILLQTSKLTPALLARVVVSVGVVLSLVAVWQFVGESMAVDRSLTGICPTCLQPDIGFARPSGFSQEPEHFSTVLFAPLVVSLTLLVSARLTKRQQYLLWAGVVSMLTAFLLAASRSGLLALVGVLLAFSIYAVLQGARTYVVRVAAALMLAVAVVLLAMVWSGTVGQKAGSAYVTERYIAHTSGGLLVVGEEQDRLQEVESSVQKKETVQQQSGSDDFNYITEGAGYGPSGAIAYSAQSRLETYKMALSIWTENAQNFVLGVGWGNFGASAQQREPAAFAKNTIVNNQYLQVGVELGLVGVLLAVMCAWQFARLIYQSVISSQLKLAIFVLFGVYGVQLLFYSGLHLLQFWLSAAVTAYILVVYEKKSRRQKTV